MKTGKPTVRTIAVTVTNVNEAPNTVADNNYLIGEAAILDTSGSATIEGVLFNDSDPENDPLTVTQINGASFTPGTPIVLNSTGGTSGDTLTMNSQWRIHLQYQQRVSGTGRHATSDRHLHLHGR